MENEKGISQIAKEIVPEIDNTKERFVAFIDIMGFKDYVSKNSHHEVLERLKTINTWIETIKKINKEERVVDEYDGEEAIPHIFSDSIVLFTKTNTIKSARLLLYTCNYLFIQSIINHIPVKGAIAYGLVTTDYEKSIFFGQPIIDAFLLQEDLKYYGLTLHHSAETQLKNYDKSLERFAHQIIKLETPTKTGKISYYNLNINFHKKSIEEQKLCLEALYESVSGPPRIYVDNTIGMFEKFQKPTIGGVDL